MDFLQRVLDGRERYIAETGLEPTAMLCGDDALRQFYMAYALTGAEPPATLCGMAIGHCYSTGDELIFVREPHAVSTGNVSQRVG